MSCAGTFEVTAFDDLTQETNKLGYTFAGTVPLDWVALAKRKREAVLSERRRVKAEKEAQLRQAAERSAGSCSCTDEERG
jgi:hypothetical protein